MCLEHLDLDKTKKLKKSNGKIIGYKILHPNDHSIFQPYVWKKGLNVSDRKSTSINKKMKCIGKGFHFFADEPESCTISNNNDFCRNSCSHRYEFQCTNENPINKVVKFEIDPKDIVAVGTWNYTTRKSSFVAIKATWIEEV